MLSTKKAFRGGMLFGAFEGHPAGPVESVALPEKILVPLQQGVDGPVQSQVEVHDRVVRGQIIGRCPAGAQAPVHSPVCGTVEQVGNLEGVAPEVVCINVEDSEDTVGGQPLGADFRSRPAHEVAEVLFQAGVASMHHDGIPVSRNTRGVDPGNLDTLIVAAMETGVLAVSPETLVGLRVQDLATGIGVLAHALQVEQTHIAVDDESPQFASRLEGCLATEPNVRIHRLGGVYPRHWDEPLTAALAGRRVPNDGRACDVGVVCVDLQTALAAFDAVVRGLPVIEQLLILGGPGYTRAGVVRAPIGMRVGDLIGPRLRQDMEVRLVEGGLLSGRSLDPDKRVVTRELRRIDALREDRERTLLAFLRPGRALHSYGRTFLSHWRASDPLRCDSNLHGEKRPCISCAACDEVCPRELLPYWLSRQVRSNKAQAALGFELHACIECGLCSYVCPSKIPLMEDIQQGKTQVATEQVRA